MFNFFRNEKPINLCIKYYIYYYSLFFFDYKIIFKVLKVLNFKRINLKNKN